MKGKRIVMLGTRPDGRGGVATVVSVLAEAGMFERCGIEYLATHAEGSAVRKLAVFTWAGLRLAALTLFGRALLLHVHLASRASFWRKSIFLSWAALLNIPVVIHLHGGEFHIFFEKECGPRRQRFIRWIFGRAGAVIVLSDAWRAWVQGQIPLARVSVMANPTRLHAVPPNEAREGYTLLFLSRVVAAKGIFELIQALAKLVDEFPALKLKVGGDGDLAAVSRMAESLGVGDRIEFLGWVRGESKIRLLNTATIYVLPSYNEGLPMGVLEAMSAGMAIVATRVGGIPEAIEDELEGFLVPPGDVEQLALSLRRLLLDGDLRVNIGAAARRKAVTHFDVNNIVLRLEGLYADILKGQEVA